MQILIAAVIGLIVVATTSCSDATFPPAPEKAAEEVVEDGEEASEEAEKDVEEAAEEVEKAEEEVKDVE